MAKDQIVPILNVEQLKKILFLQKVITQQAKKELLQIAQDALIPDNPEGMAEQFMTGERVLLEKYASYPTLTEFRLMPNLGNATKWGATFGVALLVGELILQQVEQMGYAQFHPALRHLYVLLLSEMNIPRHKYLTEPIEKALQIKISKVDGKEVDPTKEKAYEKIYVSQLVKGLAETMLTVSNAYGLVKSPTDGHRITPLGHRILLHLVDAGKFVEEMAEAHKRFQKSKPKLSMG